MSPSVEKYRDQYLTRGLFNDMQALGFAWGRQEGTYGEVIDWLKQASVEVSVNNVGGKWVARAHTIGDDENPLENTKATSELEALKEAVKLGSYVYRIMYYDDYHFNYD